MAKNKAITYPARTENVRPRRFYIDAEAQIIELGFLNLETGDWTTHRYGPTDFAAIIAAFPQLAQLRDLAVDIAVNRGDENAGDWEDV